MHTYARIGKQRNTYTVDGEKTKSSEEKKNEHILYPPVSTIPAGVLSNNFETLELWQPVFSFNTGT